jgi:hypothetical protein
MKKGTWSSRATSVAFERLRRKGFAKADMGHHARRRHGVGDAPAEVQPAGASEHIGARVPEGDAEMVAGRWLPPGSAPSQSSAGPWATIFFLYPCSPRLSNSASGLSRALYTCQASQRRHGAMARPVVSPWTTITMNSADPPLKQQASHGAGRVRRPRAAQPHQVSGRLPLREAAPADRHERGTLDDVAWLPTKSPLTAAMESVDRGVLSH